MILSNYEGDKAARFVQIYYHKC